ncbi:MAG: nitrogenase component 1 [Lachnospiraceae bacterium]|nr:nitrogenase component 1 [Lachnospiraceae bacterium]
MLSYYLPKPAKPHTVLRIPGSHTLFIGPSACSRRHAFHESMYGDRRNISFLFITEADVISGDYENLIGDAVSELLDVLHPAPHIFLLGVFCIDDFLGTDEEALMAELQLRFPGCHFAVEHIDPVSMEENRQKSGMKKTRNMYRFLDPADRHDQGINFLGNFVSLDPECEFLQLLEQWGAGPVRELFHCETYEDYQAMAKSRLAVGMRHVSDDVMHCMTDDLDIPYYYFPTSYDMDIVAEGYRKLAGLLDQPEPDLGHFMQETAKEVEQTVKELGSTPLAIDCSAFLMPFQGAAALLKYGFQVRYIFYKPFMAEPDERAEQWVKQHYPHIQFLRKDRYDHMDTLCDPECLAIGVDAARLLKTEKVADIWHDEGYFGFHGIRRLMCLLRESGMKQDGRK